MATGASLRRAPLRRGAAFVSLASPDVLALDGKSSGVSRQIQPACQL